MIQYELQATKHYRISRFNKYFFLSFLANNSQTTANRCRRNQNISTISGTEFEVVSSSAPSNPRDKFVDLPPTYDEAVKVHMSVFPESFPSEPAPEYTPNPTEESNPTAADSRTGN